ncbi:MAG: ATP-dependent zinc metalloprotease FtsH [Anaerolineae bacterium]|nr:ATP-dependent zinc metalloprotease FtsH [Anaerolineae bacterium]
MPGGINFSRILLIVGLIILTVLAFQFLAGQLTGDNRITMSELAELVNEGEVNRIVVSGDELEIELSDGDLAISRKEPNTSLYETLDLLGVPSSALAGVDVEVVGPGIMSVMGNVLLTLLPIVVIGWLAFTMMRSMRGSQDQAMSFGRSRAKLTNVDRPTVTFDDVAGMEESKQEVSEIVEFLEEPEKFIRLGARVPKGVLMIGPPGTGKTLLARAIAGEAGVPFLSISGSEFVEMFVGVGASRVRDLFDKAKQVAPAIVFVDEIDAVGRMRGTGLGGGHDEREQTLNQILVEMDGFDNNTNVIIIAATNRADVLDPALMRPGRFDRKVYISRPDVKGRREILEVHSRGKPLLPDVDLETMAKLTPGFSGADIENLVNEAAILAAQRGRNGISMAEMQDAMEKMVAGPERRSHVVSPEEKEIVAYHEAGHAVVMYHLAHSDPVHKITIIPRGQAGGFTMSLPESMDNGMLGKDQLEDMITGLLGGRAAEELTFERITTGASNDLERATSIARAMATRYGMSDKLGLRVYGEDSNNMVFLGRSISEQRDYSEQTARDIDEEVSRFIHEAYDRARKILANNRDKLVNLAQTLLEVETVDRDQFEALMEGNLAAAAV